MSWVKFDVQSDGRFLASLKDLGSESGDRILAMLDNMSGHVSWNQMIRDYHWHEVILASTDSFPSANQLYSFVLYLSTTEVYEVFAHNFAPPEVVCVLARVVKLGQ